mgnify:CR=1 FL=1
MYSEACKVAGGGGTESRDISLRSLRFMFSASVSPSLRRLFAPDTTTRSLLTKRRKISLVSSSIGYASMRERGSTESSHVAILSTSTVRSSRPTGISAGPTARKSE